MASGQSSRRGGGSLQPEIDRTRNARAQKRHRDKKKAYVQGLEVQLTTLQAEVDRLREDLPKSSSSAQLESSTSAQHTPSHSVHSSNEPSTSSSNTSPRWISSDALMAVQNTALQEENKRLREMVCALRRQLDRRGQHIMGPPPSTDHLATFSSSRPIPSHVSQGYATQPSTPSDLHFISPPTGTFRRSLSDADRSGLHYQDHQRAVALSSGFMMEPRDEAKSSRAARSRTAAATYSLLGNSATSEATLRPPAKAEEEDDPLAMLRSSLGIRQTQSPHLQEYTFPPYGQPTRNQQDISTNIHQPIHQNFPQQPGVSTNPFLDFPTDSRIFNLQSSQEYIRIPRGNPNLSLANPTLPTCPGNHQAPSPDFNVTEDFLARWQAQYRSQQGDRQ